MLGFGFGFDEEVGVASGASLGVSASVSACGGSYTAATRLSSLSGIYNEYLFKFNKYIWMKRDELMSGKQTFWLERFFARNVCRDCTDLTMQALSTNKAPLRSRP